MAQVDTRALEDDLGSRRAKAPSVLVVLVARDGEAWLQQCLMGLSRQTHPRLGVLALDNGSADGSAALLEAALGPGRVMKLEANEGFAGAIGRALGAEVTSEADYVLFLHDDTVLAPDAIANLVRGAGQMPDVGVVGPKVLDWEDPRVLREIGLSTDRFGYAYSQLEDGEVDHGQYDRIREVSFVSSCAMMVSQEALRRVGAPDERLATGDDLDFCWRAQLAGFHVLMDPSAVAHHRGAGLRGERRGTEGGRSRYRRERAALAAILKNYGLLYLVWILPLYLAQGLVRVGLLALIRRFEDAYQVLAAWGWNVVHLPGTLRRRVRAQAVRQVSDRTVRRSMAPATIRLRAWAGAASAAIAPRREDGADHEWQGAPSGLSRLLRLARAHPVGTAWAVGAVLGIIAYRNVIVAASLSGGGLAAFPAAPSGFLREFLSGVRHTGLGGTQAASPALALLGVGSALALRSPALLQKLLLMALPAVAAAGCYRTVRDLCGNRSAAVLAGGAFALSPVVLWSFAQGRLPELVFLAGLPWLAGKVRLALSGAAGIRTVRLVVGSGLGIAVLSSFFPGAVLAGGLLAATGFVSAGRRAPRWRGLARLGGALVVAAALAAPVTLAAVRSRGLSLGQPATFLPFPTFARLSVGSGPGTWATAFAVPVAAALSLVFVSRRLSLGARRSAFSVLTALYLAWASAAGYLPHAVSNPAAYVGVAAFDVAVLAGVGLGSVLGGMTRASFGRRQIGAAAIGGVLAVGLAGQAIQAGSGSWMVSGDAQPASYAAVQGATGAPFRVLWLGRAGGDPFPAPGGLPNGNVAAGLASVRFAVTGPEGASALDIGRFPSGPGYDALRRALTDVLAGTTRHGGALLAPFGIRFVVLDPAGLPAAVRSRLGRQVDLDRIPTQGLLILSSSKAVPLAAVVAGAGWRRAAIGGGAGATQSLAAPVAAGLQPAGGDRYRATVGRAGQVLALLAQQFDGRWRLGADGGTEEKPRQAFGWAVAFGPLRASRLSIRYGGQSSRDLEVAVLAALWLIALWITRRPVRGVRA